MESKLEGGKGLVHVHMMLWGWTGGVIGWDREVYWSRVLVFNRVGHR